jgi:hypothetical protein
MGLLLFDHVQKVSLKSHHWIRQANMLVEVPWANLQASNRSQPGSALVVELMTLQASPGIFQFLQRSTP